MIRSLWWGKVSGLMLNWVIAWSVNTRPFKRETSEERIQILGKVSGRSFTNVRKMALVNFSLPYQSMTMAPFLYASSIGGHTTVNNLRLNAVLPPGSAPDYNERESFHNEPYAPPSTIKYHQHRRNQSAQQRSHEIYTEHTSFSTQDTRYTMYNQDFKRTQPRQQQQQQLRPPPPLSSFQRSSESIKTRIEEQENYPERSIG